MNALDVFAALMTSHPGLPLSPALPIQVLYGCHAGETCTVIGKGPSLRHLRRDMIPDGLVITLNHALLKIIALGIDQDDRVVYSMQKDGFCCDVPSGVALIIHQHESRNVLLDHRPRYLFDNPADLGLEVHDASLPTTIKIAELFGCTNVMLISMDSMTTGDLRRVDDGCTPIAPDPNYLRYAKRAAKLIEQSTVIQGVTWVTPQEEEA